MALMVSFYNQHPLRSHGDCHHLDELFACDVQTVDIAVHNSTMLHVTGTGSGSVEYDQSLLHHRQGWA